MYKFLCARITQPRPDAAAMNAPPLSCNTIARNPLSALEPARGDEAEYGAMASGMRPKGAPRGE